MISYSLLSCDQQSQQPEQAVVPDALAPKQIPLWPADVPDAGLIAGTEIKKDGMLENVSNPTITVYTPKEKNTGVAVVVFPGGGYNKLAIDHEGKDICEWLASIGVTGVLLKYRVPASGPHYDNACKCEIDPVKPMALQDAQRAMGIVRSRAKEFNLDSNKIGVMGFSAGGHLVADISTNYRKRAYAATDEADNVSCRPDFGIAMYPGHMTFHTSNPYDLNSTLPVDSQTPPTFILQAGDDNVDTIQHSLVYYIALKKASVPTEYHIYAKGGHGFGLYKSEEGKPDAERLPIADWEILVKRWLKTIKMTTE